jgi:hypothetical protein
MICWTEEKGGEGPEVAALYTSKGYDQILEMNERP